MSKRQLAYLLRNTNEFHALLHFLDDLFEGESQYMQLALPL